MSFAYNADGLRTSKTVNDVTTNYYYSGSQLIAEETSGNITVYLYDASGSVIGMQYHAAGSASTAWDIYWFEKNLQGDVVAIYNSVGAKLISYTYDAWGNFTPPEDSTSIPTVVTNNPFTYRGYYYDYDLGLYYLQSRYYNSEIGRFISADAFPSTGQGIIGNNMFAYCGNNPVTRTDIGGYFWDTVLDVISLGVSIANVIENPDDPMAWLGVAADVASLIIPCVSGGGALVRVATKADDVVDAFKAADNLGEVGEVIVKYGDEVKLPNQIKVNDAVDAWDDFLGPNQTSYNKFTGTNEMDRIFSADGTRSIRFGGHEMRSIGTTKAHFHYENWLFDPTSNTVYVENILQRLK